MDDIADLLSDLVFQAGMWAKEPTGDYEKYADQSRVAIREAFDAQAAEITRLRDGIAALRKVAQWDIDNGHCTLNEGQIVDMCDDLLKEAQ